MLPGVYGSCLRIVNVLSSLRSHHRDNYNFSATTTRAGGSPFSGPAKVLALCVQNMKQLPEELQSLYLFEKCFSFSSPVQFVCHIFCPTLCFRAQRTSLSDENDKFRIPRRQKKTISVESMTGSQAKLFKRTQVYRYLYENKSLFFVFERITMQHFLSRAPSKAKKQRKNDTMAIWEPIATGSSNTRVKNIDSRNL